MIDENTRGDTWLRLATNNNSDSKLYTDLQYNKYVEKANQMIETLT